MLCSHNVCDYTLEDLQACDCSLVRASLVLDTGDCPGHATKNATDSSQSPPVHNVGHDVQGKSGNALTALHS